ncbi:MAG TPA: gamma carbonic anhydrase family protein [Gammaproteobacteria bacterium]|nr:gamma carbonic anhydrase family protein [Gammaproteobacteria bacterium]
MPLRQFEGHAPRLGRRVYVDTTAVVVGQVTLDDDVSIWPHVAARGDVNTITIGARSNIQDNTVLHVTHDGPYTPDGGIPLVIGEDVTVGHGCILHACTIGSRVLVGMGAIVMDGAVVEDEVLIAAGTLVPPGKRLESGFLYRGNPVQKARELSAEEREMLRYSAHHYVRLKDRYLAGAQA